MGSGSLYIIVQVKCYLCLFNFANISKLFSKIAVSICTPTSKIWVLLFPIFANIWYWQSTFWDKGRMRERIGFLCILCYLFFFEISNWSVTYTQKSTHIAHVHHGKESHGEHAHITITQTSYTFCQFYGEQMVSYCGFVALIFLKKYLFLWEREQERAHTGEE